VPIIAVRPFGGVRRLRGGAGPGADLKRERGTSDTSAQTPRGRRGRLGRRGLAAAALAAVVLVLLGTVAYAAVRPANDEAARQLRHRSGRIRIKNSRGGDALVGMQGMLPGDHVAGTVTIGNASRQRARFYLGLSKLVETQGTGGGRLSYRLVLTVKRVSTKRRPQLIYSGPLRQMPLIKLGAFRARETRTYRFAVLFPAGGTSMDDRFQRASTSLQFTWYARRAR
jgi:hypothetical protein